MDSLTPTPSRPQGLLNNVLSVDELDELVSYFLGNPALDGMAYDEFGRKLLGSQTEDILVRYSELLLPVVRNFFGSQTLVPSYSLFAEYSASEISLHRHTDANACTYTLDLVLYQDEPWSFYVDGTEYVANPNEAILFMGEDVPHWRETVTENTNRIGLVFFHYVEPEHWWFTNGPEYVEIVREAKRSTALDE